MGTRSLLSASDSAVTQDSPPLILHVPWTWQACSGLRTFFFFLIDLFILFIFIFGCIVSLLLCTGFL